MSQVPEGNNDSYGFWMVSKYEISSLCQLPASSRKIPLLKCKAKQSNSVVSNSKKSVRANKFSQQPSQRKEKALVQGPVQPGWDSHKAWFIRNHWKSYKAHAAFLSPVTNFHFGRNNVSPCSCHLACWFFAPPVWNWWIRPGTMGTNGRQAPLGRPACVPFHITPSLNRHFNNLTPRRLVRRIVAASTLLSLLSVAIKIWGMLFRGMLFRS